MSTILANGKPVEIGDQKLCVIVHNNGIKIKVPDALEIGITQTLKETDGLTQRQWHHISTGPLFQECYRLMFGPEGEDPGLPIPETVDDLKDADEGIRHVSGMIIMLCEASPAFNNGKPKYNKIFLNHPETFLHPKQERKLIGMLEFIYKVLYGETLSNRGVSTIEEPESPAPDAPETT